MVLSLDTITLGVPEVEAARAFYTTAFSPAASPGQDVDLELHGTSRFALHPIEALAANAGVESATSGFRGYVLTYIVGQPTEVRAVLDTAVQAGADVLAPAKKALFGSFSGVVQAPDGAIWKLAAATNSDTGPAGDPPRPTEATIILGVAKPKVSKAFYEALGMGVDRDYGSKYVDFHPRPGMSRLCLMEHGVLAKDVRVDKNGAGFRAIVLEHRAESREDVNALLTAAVSAGGRSVAAAVEDGDSYSGYFGDPDGFLWRVSC